MLPLYEELASLLKCNIMAYDYSGWVSGGRGRLGTSVSRARSRLGCSSFFSGQEEVMGSRVAHAL